MRLRHITLLQEYALLRSTRSTRNGRKSPILGRGFLTSASQSVTASQTLPYARKNLYPIIADITAYPSFLPFCTTAKVLEWSQLDVTQRRWPSKAILGVGWGSIHEQYVSRVYCVPDRIVEALAGEATTGIPLRDLKSIYGSAAQAEARGMGSAEGDGSLFKSLRSTWTLQDNSEQASQPATKVDLKIDFEFQSPLYAAMAGAAIPQVAQKVLDAFNKRARSIINEQNASIQTRK